MNQRIEEHIRFVVDLFKRHYPDKTGFPVYILDGDSGKPLDRRNLLPELDDYVPFFWIAGEQEYVRNQVRILKQYLKKRRFLFYRPQIRCRYGPGLPGIFRKWLWHADIQDYVEIFFGLIELYSLSGSRYFLEPAEELFRRIADTFDRWGILCSWRIMPFGPVLGITDAMAGMYVEIAADLARVTKNPVYLERAEKWARTWIETPAFKEYGVFPVYHAAWPWNLLPGIKKKMLHAELAKAGTSVASGLVALASPPFRLQWAVKALDRWVTGLYQCFMTRDFVLAQTPKLKVTDEYGPVLSTNFAAMDILCDLYYLTNTARYLDLARNIGDYFLKQQFAETGLFPDEPGDDRSYLDGNTDLAVSLAKLAELTGRSHYREAGYRAVEGVMAFHRCRYGYYRDIDGRSGQPGDRVVETRFVSLFLKALLLYGRDMEVYGEDGNWSVFRDR